jgi:hypothetical protein
VRLIPRASETDRDRQKLRARSRTNFMIGDLAEVLIHDRALSESEQATTDAYLRDKYNLP